MPAPTSDTVKAIVVRLADRGFPLEDIIDIVQLSEGTVRSICRSWVETGSIERPRTCGLVGRPRALTLGDLSYLTARLKRSPYMHLDDMQAELASVCNVRVGRTTLSDSDTLRRHGITKKKVRYLACMYTTH
ncbi:hypothetical protein FRC12_007207 [Ceratobasidium sp. 428]|nr:hypothetical protein FRC12_007207 [Ceratobasidium sp. 428]